ncbi:hypothetical protein R1sor_022098 [Riccia sorocarpa]|uniref:Small ribosomal subunit protein uS10c n=1 Tax=Riccia sorocarpa TaxID=122646 RepID=A0ABD3GIV7_9MARC
MATAMTTRLGVVPAAAAVNVGTSVRSANNADCSSSKVCMAAPLQSSFVGCKLAPPSTTSSVEVYPRRSMRIGKTVVAAAAGVTAPSKQKIRIKLRSYWVPLIEQACQQILEAAKNTNALTMGPVPLPTKKRVYCVLRSPHVDKDSREHFEIRTHRRLIDLANPNAQTIDALMQLDLPAGVDVEVKLS